MHNKKLFMQFHIIVMNLRILVFRGDKHAWLQLVGFSDFLKNGIDLIISVKYLFKHSVFTS